MSEHSAHLTSLSIGFRTWFWRYTSLWMLIDVRVVSCSGAGKRFFNRKEKNCLLLLNIYCKRKLDSALSKSHDFIILFYTFTLVLNALLISYHRWMCSWWRSSLWKQCWGIRRINNSKSNILLFNHTLFQCGHQLTELNLKWRYRTYICFELC